MDSMRANFEHQHDPKVGIFWYDETKDCLFGVTAVEADELPFDRNGRKTTKTLHKTWWKKQQERAKAKGERNSVFMRDYTLIPRGRIFQLEDGAFELMCGSWITSHIVDLVKEEFDLSQVTQNIDEHWEIGHGWDEEIMYDERLRQ